MQKIAFALFTVLLARYSWGLSSEQQCREVIQDFQDLCPWTQEILDEDEFECISDPKLLVDCTDKEVVWMVQSDTEKRHPGIELMMHCNTSSGRNGSTIYLHSSINSISTNLPENYTHCTFSACYRDDLESVHIFLKSSYCVPPYPSQVTYHERQSSSESQPSSEVELTSEPLSTTTSSSEQLSSSYKPLSTTTSSSEQKLPNSGQVPTWPYFTISIAIPGVSLFVTSVLAIVLAVMIFKLLQLRKRQLRNMSIKHGIPISQGLHLPDVLVDTTEFPIKQLNPTRSEESLCQSFYGKTINKLELENDIDPDFSLQQQNQTSSGDDYYEQKMFALSGELFSFDIEPNSLLPLRSLSPDFDNCSAVEDSGYMDTTSPLNSPPHSNFNDNKFRPSHIADSTINNTEDLSNLEVDFDWEPVRGTYGNVSTTTYMTCDKEELFPVEDFPCNNTTHTGYIESQLSHCNNNNNSVTALTHTSSLLYLDNEEVFSVEFEDEKGNSSGYLFDSSNPHYKIHQ